MLIRKLIRVKLQKYLTDTPLEPLHEAPSTYFLLICHLWPDHDDTFSIFYIVGNDDMEGWCPCAYVEPQNKKLPKLKPQRC